MISADLCQLFKWAKNKKVDQECLTIQKSEAETSKSHSNHSLYTERWKKIIKPQGIRKILKIQKQFKNKNRLAFSLTTGMCKVKKKT